MNRHKTIWPLLGILLALFAAHAPQAQSQKKDEEKTIVARASSRPRPPATVSDDPNFVIGPQDVLDISVWKEANISRSVPVRPDGKISLPLLNDIQATGLTPMQLAAQIAEKLRRFLTDPQVTVIVTQINSQRVYILGEVTRPGAYPLFPNMTVLHALSSAGGFTAFADQKKIHVVRDVNGKQVRINFNYKDVISGRKPEENVPLKPGDTVVVP